MDRKTFAAAAALALAPLLLGVSCQTKDTYRTGADLQGVVRLGPFPKQGPGVGGYNLYLASAPGGPFTKINSDPVSGGTSLLVPYLKSGQTYYFRMTSVAAKDPSRESVPGGVFARTAQESWN